MFKKRLWLTAVLLSVALCTACHADSVADRSDLCEPAKAVSPAPQEKSHSPEEECIDPATILEPPAESPASDPNTTKEAISGDGFLTDIENQIMNLINQERASLGLRELEYDPMLQNTARIRSKELCQQMSDETLSHSRPDGSSWSTVLTRDIPIPYLQAAGEILAREKTSNGNGSVQEPIPAKDWFLLWKASEPHYDNITWPEAERFGVGIYYEVRDGEYYTNATVHFGIFDDVSAPNN